MTTEPKFSIITINYNNADGLKKTIESVASQIYKNYEFIIIDGSSSDSSKDLILENTSFIKHWVSEKDNGRYDAMNKGIKLANGEYLIFMNSGDYFNASDVLSKVANINCKDKVFYGDIKVTKEGVEQIITFSDKDINKDFFIHNALPHQATFFHKSVFKELGLYSEKYQIYSDLDFYLKIIFKKIKITHIDVVIANYDLNGISSDPKKILIRNKEKAEIFNSNLGFPSINFLTIVLNGMPFIQYHIEIFKQLPFKWHWHIVEGAAELKHDTSWSLANGGKLLPKFYKNGLSIDGTTEYLNKLQKEYPKNITIYRKDGGKTWDGKTEMVNAPLKNIKEECLLWHLDSDEIWTLDQFIKGRELFMLYPEKTAAFYLCNFFVGPNLVLNNIGSYANNLKTEWLRTWRYRPGDSWIAHEPPMLGRKLNDNPEFTDLAKIDPFIHAHTEAAGLVFQHYAYVTKDQILFKEKYYGMNDLLNRWENLNKLTKFPVKLNDYFPWVDTLTLVYNSEILKVKPLLGNISNEKFSLINKDDNVLPLLNTPKFILIHELLFGDQSVELLKSNETFKLINNKLTNIEKSKTWRILMRIQSLKLKLIPDGSKRRHILKLIYNLIKK